MYVENHTSRGFDLFAPLLRILECMMIGSVRKYDYSRCSFRICTLAAYSWVREWLVRFATATIEGVCVWFCTLVAYSRVRDWLCSQYDCSIQDTIPRVLMLANWKYVLLEKHDVSCQRSHYNQIGTLHVSKIHTQSGLASVDEYKQQPHCSLFHLTRLKTSAKLKWPNTLTVNEGMNRRTGAIGGAREDTCEDGFCPEGH